MSAYDLAIVGAGLAGSGLATALARRGWRVLLLERDQFPRHKVCGEFLSPESQASLRALGLDRAVAALDPCPIPHALLCGQHARLRTTLPGNALGVSRYALDDALARAAADAGAELRMRTAVTDIRHAADGVTLDVRAADAETFDARAVVLAAGRHAPRRLRAETTRAARTTYVGIKGHWSGVEMPPEVQIYLFDGGYVGVSPVEGGRVNVCALVRRDVFAAFPAGAANAARALRDTNPQLTRLLRDATLDEHTVVTVANVDTNRPSTPWDGYARLGDAATMIPPLCGDGQAMALRSAELCAPLADAFLRGASSLDGWERAYRRAWHREFDGRLRLGRSLQWALQRPAASDLLLRAGTLLPGVVGRIVRATRGAQP